MKIYADEAGSTTVRNIENLVMSAIALVEVVAAISRKDRTGDLSASDARILTAEFEADLAGDCVGAGMTFTVVAVGDQVIERAALLAVSHELRAYDAIQLASAVEVRNADAECTSFVCFDADLNAAAMVHGFEIIGA